MRIAICDDQLEFLEYAYPIIFEELKKHLLEIFFNKYIDGNELLEANDASSYDAVFLDIEMPDINGFKIADILKQKNKDVLLIFISNKDEYTYESFDYQPVKFLPKHRFKELISDTTEKLISKFQSNPYFYYCKTVDLGMVRININNIIYVESCRNAIKIYTSDCIYKEYKNIGIIEKELKDFYFVRTHKGFIVNLKYIYTFKDSIILETEKEIPIGRAYNENLKEKFNIYVREKL